MQPTASRRYDVVRESTTKECGIPPIYRVVSLHDGGVKEITLATESENIMQIKPTHIVSLLLGTSLLNGALSQTGQAQGLLNESGTSTLAPAVVPIGGYGANPQEYLGVSWSVVENASGTYLYSYTVHNPAGDVVLNPAGGLTSTPEVFDGFSVDFNTTLAGEYLPGTLTGGAYQEVNPVGTAWFFNPAVAAGSSGGTVSFQSDFPPTSGEAGALGAMPWSSYSPNGQEVAVPDLSGPPTSVPEPAPMALFAAAGLFFVPFGFAMKKKTCVACKI
jgi:hypothetical protein